jgi:hypothetical protein
VEGWWAVGELKKKINAEDAEEARRGRGEERRKTRRQKRGETIGCDGWRSGWRGIHWGNRRGGREVRSRWK